MIFRVESSIGSIGRAGCKRLLPVIKANGILERLIMICLKANGLHFSSVKSNMRLFDLPL